MMTCSARVVTRLCSIWKNTSSRWRKWASMRLRGTRSRYTPTPGTPVHKKAFLYTNETDLLDIIASWVKGGLPKGDFNAYKEFTPVHVMARFDRILIQRALEARKKMSLQVKIKGAKKNSNRLCTPR